MRHLCVLGAFARARLAASGPQSTCSRRGAESAKPNRRTQGDRHLFPPRTLELKALIPVEGRKEVWKTLIPTLTGEGASAPVLVRPKWLSGIVMLLCPAVAFALAVKWAPLSPFWMGYFMGYFGAILVGYLGAKLTTGWRTRFPSACSQVKDLIPFVKTLDCSVWSRDEVLEKVRTIAVANLGVKPEQVQLESHWVNDLGAG